MCLIPGADGIPHAAKGMLAEFQVTEATGEAAAVPSNDGEIVTNEYSFTIPADFSGKGTFEVVNQGEQNHEMAVYAIAEGKTARRRAGVLLVDRRRPTGPPPITPSGGIAPAAPGRACCPRSTCPRGTT